MNFHSVFISSDLHNIFKHLHTKIISLISFYDSDLTTESTYRKSSELQNIVSDIRLNYGWTFTIKKCWQILIDYRKLWIFLFFPIELSSQYFLIYFPEILNLTHISTCYLYRISIKCKTFETFLKFAALRLSLKFSYCSAQITRINTQSESCKPTQIWYINIEGDESDMSNTLSSLCCVRLL